MPKPIQIDLEKVAQDPDRAKIKYANKAVIMKMYSVKKPSLDKWLSKMANLDEFTHGVLHPTHKIVLVELDVFDEFVRWMDRNRYRQRKY